MKTLSKLSILGSYVLCGVSLAACSNQNIDPEATTTPSITETISEDAGQAPDVTIPEVSLPASIAEYQDTDPHKDEIPEEKHEYIYNKEYIQPTLNSVTLKNDWQENIYVGDVAVSITEPTEFCSLPNYFFEEPLNGDHPFVESHFYKSTSKPLQTQVPFTDTIMLEMNAGYVHYESAVNIDSLTFAVSEFFYPDFISYLSETNPEINDEVISLGSTYENVVALMGEPTGISEEETFYGKNKYVNYSNEKLNIDMVFVSSSVDGDLSDMRLAVISWVPKYLRTGYQVYNDSLDQ